MREIETKRTRFSKTFDLGDGRYRLEIGRLPCHFERNGKLHDIDLTPVLDSELDQYSVNNCPYSLKVSNSSPAHVYNSQSGKRVSIELNAQPGKPLVEHGLFKWAEVGRDSDYIIQPLPAGCATLLVLNSPDAPRKWSWQVGGDMSLIVPLVGKDSAGRHLEIIERRDSDKGIIEVEWTGRTLLPHALRRKKGIAWTDDVTWPVVIDPTVNENIVSGGDDIYSIWAGGGATSSGFNTYAYTLRAGRTGAYRLYAGLRFQTIPVPPAATINSATLTVRVITVLNTPDLNVYGNDVNDAPVWDAGSNRVKNISKTTAVTNKASWTSDADNAITVTAVVAEIVARAGWASNNDIAFGVFNNAPSGDHVLAFASLEHTTLTEARLSIDYSAAAATPAAASSAGVATAIARGASTRAAAMSSSGVATAVAVGRSTWAAVGNAVGSGGAAAVSASTARADGQSDGVATAVANGEGGIVIVVPDFTPVGGGGAIPPVRDRDKRFRIRKDKTRPHVIRVGDWPTEAQMAEMADALARAERQDFARFISGIQEPEPVEDYDEDDRALMLILAAA